LPGENARFTPPADAHESNPPNLFEKQNVLEKISSDLATLDRTEIFLKIGGSGLDRTEKIFVVLM